MNHDLYKAYYEYLAKLVLETILPAHFKNMSLQDKPDLINFDGKGVEVTRALFEGDGERTGRFRKVKNKEEHKIDKKDLIRLDQLHSHILFMQGKAAGLVPPAQWCTLAEAEKAFTDKLQKINNYNSIFALFIYAPTFNWYELEMIEDFTQWAANTHKLRKPVSLKSISLNIQRSTCAIF